MTTICPKCHKVFDVKTHDANVRDAEKIADPPPEPTGTQFDPVQEETALKTEAGVDADPFVNKFLVSRADGKIFIGNSSGISSMSITDARNLAAWLIRIAKREEISSLDVSHIDMAEMYDHVMRR